MKHVTMTAVVLSVLCGLTAAGAAEELRYNRFPLIIVANNNIVESEHAQLPQDIIDLVSPFQDEAKCPGLAFFPEAKLIRYDLDSPYVRAFQETSDPIALEKEATQGLNSIQKALRKRPEFEQVEALAIEKLKIIQSPTALAVRYQGKHEISAVAGSWKEVFVLPGTAGDADEVVKKLMSSVPPGLKLIPTATPQMLRRAYTPKLCAIAGRVDTADVPAVVVWYKPYIEPQEESPIEPQEESPPRSREPPPGGPSPEAVQQVRQGLTYISLGKIAKQRREKGENYANAVGSFTKAIDTESKRESCYANAYMNRGLVYALQRKPHLALRDLLKAAECDPKNPTIAYNLAAVHSLSDDKDLAIEALDKALELGFSDCDALRADPDLKNVRKSEEFRRTLERHKLFCL